MHKDSYYEWQAQTFFHVISYIQLGTFCLNTDHRFSFPTSNQQTIYWPGSQTHYDRHTFSSSKSYSEQVTKDRNTMPQALSRYGQVHSVESILKQSRLLCLAKCTAIPCKSTLHFHSPLLILSFAPLCWRRNPWSTHFTMRFSQHLVMWLENLFSWVFLCRHLEWLP